MSRMPPEQKAVMSIIDRITLANPVFGTLRFEAMPLRDGDIMIQTLANVPERGTGRKIEINQDSRIGAMMVTHLATQPEAATISWLVSYLHRLLMMTMRHELDEMFMLDGELADDPHKREANER